MSVGALHHVERDNCLRCRSCMLHGSRITAFPNVASPLVDIPEYTVLGTIPGHSQAARQLSAVCLLEMAVSVLPVHRRQRVTVTNRCADNSPN